MLRLDAPVRVTVAGRTDTGVHARGQVVHADVPAPAWDRVPGRSARPPGDALLRRLAGVLPEDVTVVAAAVAPDGFDARFSALWRRYAYRVADRPEALDPLSRRSVLRHGWPLDVPLMHAAVQALVGEHDFVPFCRPRPGATTVRRLRELRWHREPDGTAVATVVADAFCHHMVRAMVGVSLEVGSGRRPPTWPAAVLRGGVRDHAVPVAAARGLTLEEVRYPPDDALAARARQARAVRVPSPAGMPRPGAGGRVGA